MQATKEQHEMLKANSRLTFDDYVIQKITHQCIAETPEILGMDGNVIDTVAETFGRDERVTKGIKVEVGEQQAAIDIDAVLAYDADAHAVYSALSKRVSDSVARMTGLQVIELNMHVTDVLTRKEWQSQNQ